MLRITLAMSCVVTAMGLHAAEQKNHSDNPYVFEHKVDHVIGKDNPNATNRYIVQLRSLPAVLQASSMVKAPKELQSAASNGKLDMQNAHVQHAVMAIKNEQKQALAAVQKQLGFSPKVRYSYQVAFNGFSLELSEAQAEELLALPQVLKVVRQPEYRIQTDVSPKFIGATEAWSNPEFSNGLKGEGITVGIIDSGINYNHDSFKATGDDGYTVTNPLGHGVYLGECVTNASLCNDKLIGMFSYDDIVASFGDVKATPGVDYNGHGSHVASTAAGNVLKNRPYVKAGNLENPKGIAIEGSNIPQMSGIAPHANIVTFQVCFPTGGCSMDAMVKAIEDAIEVGVDVINMSIGPSGQGLHPWENPLDMAFLAANEAGIFSSLSAGNSGSGSSTTGHLAPWTTIVANATHGRGFEKRLTSGPNATTPLPEILGTGGIDTALSGELVYIGDYQTTPLGKQCAPSEYAQLPQIKGKIVLCDRGTVTLQRMAQMMTFFGAKGFIVRNRPTSSTTMYSANLGLPSMQINQADGDALLSWMRTQQVAEVTFNGGEAKINPQLANMMSVSSSRGPYSTHPNLLVPHIAAPGQDVYAAYTDEDPFTDTPELADFAFLTGTSMASPHIAGAAALVKQANPQWTPNQVQSALMMTANPVMTKNDDGLGVKTADLWDRGAGMVQVNKAVRAGLVLDVSKSDFLAVDPENGGDLTTLNNAYLFNASCQLRCSWTRTFTAVRGGRWSFSQEGSAASLQQLTIEPASIDVEAGEQFTVTVTAEFTADAKDSAWIDSNVIATPQNGGDVLRLPVRIRPMVAQVPASIQLDYHWFEQTAKLDGYKFRYPQTVNFASGQFVKGRSIALQVKQDSNRDDVFDDLKDGAAYFLVDIKDSTKPLDVYVSDANNTDTDLFVGLDTNYDGIPQPIERVCVSAGENNIGEHCRITAPEAGRYWIMVWNWQGSTSSENRIVVDVVDHAESSYVDIALKPQTTVSAYENWPVSLEWQGKLVADTNYYGAVTVTGFSADTNKVVTYGTTEVSLSQRKMPAQVTLSSNQVRHGDSFAMQLVLPKNLLAEAVQFNLAVRLPAGVTLDSINSANAAALSSVTQTGQIVSAEFAIAANTYGKTTLTIPLKASGVVKGTVSYSYTLTSAKENLQLAAGTLSQTNPNRAPTVTVMAKPDQVIAEETAQLVASASDADGDTLSYSWRQVDGVAADLASTNGATLNVKTPNVEQASPLQFIVTVSDGEFSASEQVTIIVQPKRSGGAMHLFTLLLLPLIWRRRYVKN